MFVVTLTYTAAPERIDALRADHRAWLDPHVASGLMLVTGPQNPRVGGVLLIGNGIDRAGLEALLKQDPFALAGVADYAITEFEANKITPALAGLI